MATKKALAELTKQANELRKAAGEQPVKRFANKAKAEADIKRLSKARKPAANADWTIAPLPSKERTEPRDGTLRAQCLAKMQSTGITLEGAVVLCEKFDQQRGKKTDPNTVRRRAYELVRLVAVANGYGAKEKDGKIVTA